MTNSESLTSSLFNVIQGHCFLSGLNGSLSSICVGAKNINVHELQTLNFLPQELYSI